MRDKLFYGKATRMEEPATSIPAEKRVFRYSYLLPIIASVLVYVFVTGGLGIVSDGRASVVAFNFVMALVLAAGLMLLMRHHQIRLENGFVIITGLGDRARKIPFTDIRWVTVTDLRKGVANEGWICNVTTRQGDFRFTDQLIGYEELASILDKIARSNPSASEEHAGRS